MGEGADAVVRIRQAGRGQWLCASCHPRHIDMAYSYKPLTTRGLSHAFLNGVMYSTTSARAGPIRGGHGHQLYGSRVNVNRAGSIPSPISIPEPSLDPRARRRSLQEVGAAVARALARSPWKVALVASVELVACLPGPKHYFVYPDVDMTAGSTRRSWRRLRHLAQGPKRRSWTAASRGAEHGGAHGRHGGARAQSPDYHGYVESYVMN